MIDTQINMSYNKQVLQDMEKLQNSFQQSMEKQKALRSTFIVSLTAFKSELKEVKDLFTKLVSCATLETEE